MLKIFRKNKRIAQVVLVTGSVLLLVSWLVADGSAQLLQDVLSGTSTHARMADGTTVSSAEAERMRREARAASFVGSQALAVLGATDDVAHWYLLSREAQDAGLVGGIADGRARLADMAAQNNVPEGQLLGGLMRESRLSSTEVLETLAKVNGIERMLGLVLNSGARLSDMRLRQASARLQLGVTGDVVVLDAANVSLPGAADPSDDALQAQLDAYGSTAPGQGDKGFGYRLPDRMKVEWLRVPAQSIAALVEGSDSVSGVELRKYWLENRAEFEAAEALAAQAPTFESMREVVRARVIAKMIGQRRAEIAKFMADEMAMALRGIPQRNGYYELPEGAASRPGLTVASLSELVQKRFGMAAPETGSISERWIEPREIDTIAGLGSATTDRFGTTPVTASQLVSSVREFGGKPTLVAQRGVPSPVLTSPEGDLFVLTVTEADASRAPASIDEVRDALVRDVRRIAAYDRLAATEPEIAALAGTAGLDAVASTYGAKVDPFVEVRAADPMFLQFGMRMPSALPVIGADQAVADALADKAFALPPQVDLKDLPPSDRTFVIESPARLAMLVVRVDSLAPMNEGDLGRLMANDRFRSSLALQDVDATALQMFSKDALVTRYGYQQVAPSRETAEEGTETAGNGATTAQPAAARSPSTTTPATTSG
jgi:hypothetical protein